jgi:uncharacterized protein YecA (UPF0149 family)
MKIFEKVRKVVLWGFHMLIDPEKRGFLRSEFERMRSEGVDPASSYARKSWIRKNRRTLHKRLDLHPKRQPVVLASEPGRNEPCACGSGRKYKKCCAN